MSPLLLLPLLLLLPTLAVLLRRLHHPSAPLPPGPRPLPIIGSLHLIHSPLPHRDFFDLSKLYGPLMHLRLGSTPTILISSPQLSEFFLKTHDANFANRPPSQVMRCMSYGYKGLSFSDHGPYWRHIRRFCVTNLLTPHKIDSCHPIRAQEMKLFLQKIVRAATNRTVMDVSDALGTLVSDVSCRIILGGKYMSDDDDGIRFKELTHEFINLLGSFNVNDVIPWLRVLDVQGMARRIHKVSKVFDVFLEKIIDDHVRNRTTSGETRNDFVDIMLSYIESEENQQNEIKFDRTNIKAIVLDMLEGSMETSRTAVDWAFTELLRYPKAMNKLRDELTRVVGPDRQVEESDLPNLTYLNMVLKESLRLHPLIAILFHHGKEERILDRYRIPKGANTLVNLWAISRDPIVWPEPDKFIPERFADGNFDLRGQDYRFMPFGSGRRICVGIKFAMTFAPLILAQMVHCFEWELPEGVKAAELDMTERYGLTMPRVEHLHAMPSKRSPIMHGLDC